MVSEDVLRIDQSFVRRVTDDLDDSTIVSAIINIGKSLNHRAVTKVSKPKSSGYTFKASTAKRGKVIGSADRG